MNKKTFALIALGSFAGAVLYRVKKKRHQIYEYAEAITEILNYPEITDFKLYSDYLLEYYGIIAKNIFGKVVEYSSSDFNTSITSDDIQEYGKSGYGYDMDDLEMFFSSNREL
ncbi:MAG: hypothetical protein NC485_10165 [Ruminococcus flavefaciens]|nr:hypothetical protein [Ruminococcus flavefaciens]MCM1059261.1 hypothetical protein [Eubacterium sp.]